VGSNALCPLSAFTAKALTDSHCGDIGDYDALVLVQLAGFKDGELLLYERLQMTPMLLERYAKDGSEKSRRALLAMSQTDPEVLAEVLGYFVDLASDKLRDVSPFSITGPLNVPLLIISSFTECRSIDSKR
jgi:hypothetical protein